MDQNLIKQWIGLIGIKRNVNVYYYIAKGDYRRQWKVLIKRKIMDPTRGKGKKNKK